MRIALYKNTNCDISLQPLNVDEYDILPQYERVSEIMDINFLMLNELDAPHNIDISATLKSVFLDAQRDLERRHGINQDER